MYFGQSSPFFRTVFCLQMEFDVGEVCSKNPLRNSPESLDVRFLVQIDMCRAANFVTRGIARLTETSGKGLDPFGAGD